MKGLDIMGEATRIEWTEVVKGLSADAIAELASSLMGDPANTELIGFLIGEYDRKMGN